MDLEVLGFQVSGAQTWNPGAAGFRVQELKLGTTLAGMNRASVNELGFRAPDCQIH